MDLVLDLLRGLRLSGGVFLDGEFTAPWCVASRIGPEDCDPAQPTPRSIIAYHYVSSGRLLVGVDGEPPVEAVAGEVVVLPRNDAHLLGSSLEVAAVAGEQLVQPAADGGLARIVHGGGGAETRILCGYLGSESAADPVIASLPRVMKIAVADGLSGSWIESSFRFAATELAAGAGASPAMLARLAELLFMEAVRRYLAALPPEQGLSAAGLRDPAVARAIGLLHGGLNRRWTAADLAREVGLSRSAFAERFTRVMGAPPMHYLGTRRLEAAARRLQDSGDAIARIAFEVGYESEAAFNRAFKRHFGLPPAAWRRQRRDSPAASTPGA